MASYFRYIPIKNSFNSLKESLTPLEQFLNNRSFTALVKLRLPLILVKFSANPLGRQN